MKKNDENQNNDSGMTRRVYKKASLDDTVVNVRKDPSDDFDLSPIAIIYFFIRIS